MTKKVVPTTPLEAFEPCPTFGLASSQVHWSCMADLVVTGERFERYLTVVVIAHPTYCRGVQISDPVLGYMDVVTGLMFDALTGECTKSTKVVLDLRTLKDKEVTKADLTKIIVMGADTLVPEEEEA